MYVEPRIDPENPSDPNNRVGTQIGGTTFPALGRSQDSAWYKIPFEGMLASHAWVQASDVTLSGDCADLPVEG